jgi:hypothetical protein
MTPKGSPKTTWASRYRRSAVPTMDSDDSSEDIHGFSNESIDLPDVPRDTSVTRDLETYVLSPTSRALMTDPR